ncbi:MAG: DUF4962 domain-containing protein [Acidobacteria bacterium]|nr:DUF4962 domain-containing protein [Acidobacteriota bacterium]
MLKKYLAVIIIFAVCTGLAAGQDKKELEAEKSPSRKLKGEHPLVAVMKSAPSSLKKELEGVHPRVFLTETEIDALKEKAKTQRELWQTALARVRALKIEPPPPPAETRRAQNEVGLGISEAAFAYKMTGEKKYLDAAKKYMDAACAYDIWGYASNKPNVDLAAGHLLYGMGWGYDLLYHDLTPAEREKYRDKLAKQARLMFEFFKPKPGKTYAYSQNHTFIPIAGLAVTAYALMGETPGAKDWAALSRAIFDRVLATYSKDGYYYEGMEYWIFSTPWIVHYLDAQRHATGEDLYPTVPGLKNAHLYVAHSTLPGGEFNFDYGDIYAGPTTRARAGDDYERERIDGHFRTNYNILYNLASRYRSGEAQGVADWLKSKGQVNAEEFWTFIWYDPSVKPVAIEKQPAAHYFPDHEVVYWRSGWDDRATAFSFKAGPPEGHAARALLEKYPEWRLSSGHAHPDAGSFIIWADGKYLTGDSGYAGVPLTEHHNTVVFGGRGQNREGGGHDVWVGIPSERLDRIRLTSVKIDAKTVALVADLAAAYEPELGVRKFTRSFTFTAPDGFVVTDRIETDREQTITGFLHADNAIEKISDGRFVFEPGGTSLLVELKDPGEFETKIEKNIVTAPGPPGAVDKGTREERGVRLAISTARKVGQFEQTLTLRIKKSGE